MDTAAEIVTATMQRRPGAVISQRDFESYNSNLVFDNPGTLIGGPGTVGTAVISTAIDHLPGAPRRVVLALPDNDACYYVSVVEGHAKQYGVAHGADAVSHCFVSETAGGIPQVRPETKWTSRWPSGEVRAGRIASLREPRRASGQQRRRGASATSA